MDRLFQLNVLALIVVTAAAAPADLNYTFTVIQGPPVALEVDVQFPVKSDGPTELVLPNQYGGDREMWKWIDGLTVVSGPIELKAGAHPFLRRIEAIGGELCHVRYRLDVPQQPLQKGIYRRPVLRREYVHLLGNTFLVRPNWPERKRLKVELTWRVPKGWAVGNSFGFGQERQRVDASLYELAQSVYLAGDFRFIKRQAHSYSVISALRGDWGFADDEFAGMVSRIVGGQCDLWKDDTGLYLVSLLPVDISPGSSSGVGRWNGFAAFLPAGARIDERLLHLLSHELFHIWNPGRLFHAQLPSSMFWFSEGFTDYFSYVVLLQEGLMPFSQFVETMNRQISQYWNSPARNLPNEAAAKNYFTDAQAYQIAYLRGLLVALHWNAAIRSSSSGPFGLTDLMRALRIRAEEDQRPVDSRALAEEAERLGAAAASAQIASWIERGETVVLRADSLGTCAQLMTKEGLLPRFRLDEGADGRECSAWFR